MNLEVFSCLRHDGDYNCIVSGFLVADGSMIRAYNDSFQKYNIEDGYFRTKKKLTTTQKEDIEKSDVKIYENFYIEQKADERKHCAVF